MLVAKQHTSSQLFHDVSVSGGLHRWLKCPQNDLTNFTAGLALALVGSGWMMLAVLAVKHSFSLAQTEELVLTTVAILMMWPLTVLVLVSLVPTAALHLVSLRLVLIKLFVLISSMCLHFSNCYANTYCKMVEGWSLILHLLVDHRGRFYE